MKKRLVFGLSAILSILSTVTVGAVGDNCVKNGDFESGSDNFGICYSSRTDTKMPSISFSDEFFNDGNGALEILPGQTLEEKESNSNFRW